MKRAKLLSITVLFLTVVVLIVSINLTVAQAPPSTPSPKTTNVVPNTSPSPTSSPTPTSTSTQQSTSSTANSEVRVIDVYTSGQEAADKDNKVQSKAGIGHNILIKVSNLQSLVDQSKCLKANTKVEGCQEQEIALFLDGRKIRGIVPTSTAPRPEEETVEFLLQHNDDNKETWADLLGAPPFLDNEFFERSTEVSVGLENGYAEPTNVKGEKFKLVRIRRWLFWPCLVALVGLLIGMWRLANRSDILRDSGPTPPKPKRKSFSLARFQMAFWFFWVVTSFLFIWIITGAYDVITASTIGLIGISASTALGATVIDVSKNEESNGPLREFREEKLMLDSEIATLDKQISVTSPPADLLQLQQSKVTKQDRLSIVEETVRKLENEVTARESKGFWKDIFTDGSSGVSFHRFQIFVWTIVLGVIFLYSVWSRLSMPEFSATLLALQGISAGTYLGFKIPERQA